MTAREHWIRWLASMIVGFAAGCVLVLERHIQEIVLSTVSPENDIYSSRSLLVAFPTLLHIVVATLLPLVVIAICNVRGLTTERSVMWLFLYVVAIAAVACSMATVAARMYRGLTMH